MQKYPEYKMPFANLKRFIIYGIVFCIVVLVIFYGYACWCIGSGVKSICAQAIQKHPSDKVEALIAYINSESHTLQEKNNAIWALGQLGDERALLVLEKLYTGQICDHDRNLCQRELKKAIKLCKNGLNITAWTWR